MTHHYGKPEWEQLGIPEIDHAEPEDAGGDHDGQVSHKE